MATRYFIKVGAIAGNLSGTGARGWEIELDGCDLWIRYGGIELEVAPGGRGTEFYWRTGHPCKELGWEFATPADAQSDAEDRISKKLHVQKRVGEVLYTELPAGAVIHSSRS